MSAEARIGQKLEDTLHREVGKLVMKRLSPVSIDDIANKKKSTGETMDLYVHIPFCTEICSFCAFHRRVGNGQQQESYTSALETHIDKVLEPFGQDQKISSVLIGGGTPGLLTIGQADRVISKVRRAVDISDARITFELHPENISEEYIRGLKNSGVERFSVGIQTLSNVERKILGRDLTSAEEDLAKLQILNQLGVPYNVDLMFGTPAQSQDSWVDTLQKINDQVKPPEITVYQYVNAYGSSTKKWIAEGKVSRPDFRARKAMHSQTIDILKDTGYRQTSTYSFSKDKVTPRVLLNEGNDFLGLGPKTYSRIRRYLFINGAQTSDFVTDGNMADFYGLQIPLPLMALLNRIFGLVSRGAENSEKKTGSIGILQSEAVAQIYGVLYYITNQPNLSKK